MAEEELKASERRFRAYFEHSQIGLAVTSPSKGWLEVNGQLRQMLGYDLDELRQMTWAELTHPDDLEADTGHFGRMLAGDIDDYTMDKRFVRKDGEVVYANLAVSCVRDEAGSVDLILASLLDITKRKKAEEELRKLSQATEASPASVVITALDGTIEYVNPKFTEVTGYTPEEAIGQNPRILSAGVLPQEVYREMWETITAGREWRGEFCNRRKER